MEQVMVHPSAAHRPIARTLTPVAQTIGGWGLRPPFARVLGPLRRQAADDALAVHLPEARALAPRVGTSRGRAALAELADVAVRDMRRHVQRRARALGGLAALAARADRAFHDEDGVELMDDVNVDRDVRERVVAHLDAINHVLGCYDAFWDALRPMLAHGLRNRVLDLASGHGGLALAIARRAAADGLDVEVTATDLRPEYLERARVDAAAESLPVRFELQDAHDLSNRADRSFDVVVCSQALHHFSTWQVGVLVADAARVGERVLLVDGARSAWNGVLVTALGLVGFRDRLWAHDTWVSFRRFYVPEELELIARLAVPERHVESAWVAPGHCRVRL